MILKEGIPFYAYPFDVIEEYGGMIPIPEYIDEKHKEGVKGWVILRYKKKHPGVQKYMRRDHIVYAGCNEGELTCDSKAIFEVWHPSEEWDKGHEIKL